jgi:hypothetical protein
MSGSGEILQKDVQVADFDELVIGHGFYAQVEYGKQHSVVVRADDNFMEYVKVSSEDGVLQVDMEKNFDTGTLEVDITLPELRAAEISEGALLEGRNLRAADDLRLEASDGGNIELYLEEGQQVDSFEVVTVEGARIDAGYLTSERTKVVASQGGEAILEGDTDQIMLRVDGGSTVSAGKMLSTRAKFDVTGNSYLQVSASELAEGTVTEASFVTLLGDAELDVEVSEDASFGRND